MVWAGSAADHLSGMDQATRDNAAIDLERAGVHTDEMTQAEYLWNSGKYAEAISAIEVLESEMGDMCLGISWRVPIETESPKWGADVQVTASAYDISGIELVKAMGNNNLFIVARGSNGADTCWTLNMSTDGGSSWSETYRWNLADSYVLADVDATEYAGYIYVGYASSYSNTAWIRRFNENNGSYDSGFGFVEAITSSANILEVNLETHRAGIGELYYGVIDANNALLYSWSNNDGSTWTPINSSITNASRGLDMDYGWMSGSQHYLWLSYINTSDQLCAAARGGGVWEYHNNLATVHSASFFSTAIAMHGDTVIIFYEQPNYTLYYAITYDDGTNWSYGGGSIYADSAGSMDVTGRGNDGWHLSFSTFSGAAPEVVNYSHRGYPSGTWDARQSLGDHDAYINYKISIDYLGAAGAYGIAYIDDNFDVWFDRMDWTDIAESAPRPLPMEFKALPGAGRTTLSFVLPQAGFASLKVYDVKGALVRDLSGNYKEGMNRVEFAPSGSGTFFAILEAGDQTARTKFVTVK